MSKSPNELFHGLSSQKHGIPQYTPDPDENLPIEYRAVGVSIGDVGTWNEGSFEVVFNTCLPATHAINAVQGVPEDFVPFVLEPRQISKRPYHSPGTVITSAKVNQMTLDVGASTTGIPFFPTTVGSSVTYKFQSKECAILVLPEGASREKLLPIQTFRAYVKKHSRQWYKLAGGRLSSKDSLFVVTGCDKAASWGIATASTASKAIDFSLKFTVVGMVEGSVRPRYEWKEYGSATIHSSRDHGSERIENQCIFIRGFFVPRTTPLLALISNKFLSLGRHGRNASRRGGDDRVLIGTSEAQGGGTTTACISDTPMPRECLERVMVQSMPDIEVLPCN